MAVTADEVWDEDVLRASATSLVFRLLLARRAITSAAGTDRAAV